MSRWQRNFLLAMLLCVVSGAVVALGTKALLPTSWAHLPGGSFSAGFSTGMIARYKIYPRPGFLFLITCGLSGVCGWIIVVIVWS